MASPPADRPIALLLVPRTVERFILYDQGQDLLRAPGVVAVEAPKIPYGALGRLPRWLGDALGSAQAARLKVPGEPVTAMMFHPFQWPFARAVLARWPECRLWYGLFDRTPAAPDAGPGTRARLEELHAEASERADLVFAVSPTLVELERAAGREAILMPSAAELPSLELAHIEDPADNATGARGVGEGGTLGAAAALAGAVSDALGTDVDELPLSPEVVHRAARRAAASPSS